MSESDLAEGVAKLAVLHQANLDSAIQPKVVPFEKSLDKVEWITVFQPTN